ncbi:MAG: DNA primase [Dehalococcoidales bacterium]|nr:DNA primase [Dehalococcoidales bacterium]
MSVIEEVKQRADIVDIISQYTSLTKSGRTLRGLCPFHSEKTPSFFVYPEQQSWHCFGACGTGGDVFSFLMKKEGIDFGEALRLLGERVGVSIPSRSESRVGKDDKERLYQINEAAARYFHELLLKSPVAEKAREYAANRGLSLETITSFRLGFSLNSWDALKKYLDERGYTEKELLNGGLVTEKEAGGSYDRFRNRLIFPIRDAKGHIIGFGARALDDSLPKYLNSPQTAVFDKGGSLYGIDLAASAIREHDKVVIVEGFMDAITAHRCGFSNVVASMGTAVTEKQINILKRLTKNIILALDADAAGEEAMLRSVGYENALGAEVRVIVLPEGKDPDSVIKEDARIWQDLLVKSMPIMDYTFSMITAGLDLSTARDKSLAADRLLPIIAGMNDIVRQGHYLEKLSRLVNVTERNLENVLRRIEPKPAGSRVRAAWQKVPEKSLRSVYSSPLEEYFLALLLQHPELKKRSQDLLPEYFENSENREVFTTWRQSDDILSLRGGLDVAIQEYLDLLLKKDLMDDRIEQKYTDCILRLRERFLRGLEAKRAAALALEAELGGSTAELAKLKEQGVDTSTQLGEVFTQKSRGAGIKGVRNESGKHR